MLGQPGQPNQIIQQKVEHILLLRKPGPYRSPTPAQREAARITKEEHARWFNQIWRDFPGARKTKDHPAPFPIELPYRLARMYTFPGDTVFDPCAGTFNTTRACMKAGRNSLGVEISPTYVRAGIEQSQEYARSLAA